MSGLRRGGQEPAALVCGRLFDSEGLKQSGASPVLEKEFGKVEGVVRAKRKPYIPVVLSRGEVDQVLGRLSAPYDLVGKLLYGCALRLFECLKLRVQDLNFDMKILTVHDGKGKKDRAVPMPEIVIPELRLQLESGPTGPDSQAGIAAYPEALETQLCQSSVAGKLRYPYHSGVTRAERCEDHNDLYPHCPERHAEGSEKSFGFLVQMLQKTANITLTVGRQPFAAVCSGTTASA